MAYQDYNRPQCVNIPPNGYGFCENLGEKAKDYPRYGAAVALNADADVFYCKDAETNRGQSESFSSGYVSVASIADSAGGEIGHTHVQSQHQYEYECNINVENHRIRIISTDLDLVQTSADILSDFYAVDRMNNYRDKDTVDCADASVESSEPSMGQSPKPMPTIEEVTAPQSLDEPITISDSEDGVQPTMRARRTHFSSDAEELLNRAENALYKAKKLIVYDSNELKLLGNSAASNLLPQQWVKIAQFFPSIIR